ncbi:hypothetical protein N6H05_06490 [Sphingobium sp. WTD-1]|uniref:DUF6966 domain-containing protein n=1 Tax=Sphingobium sp. WTD-1 TaxID=2979467 RepID=UPI0024DE0ECC|nr:hypothetical protein [Sphingobium sp. WTD-1]WIA57437.1 hypothetical protein N6H05_06490 [Sphingobium sp. WTD-1]
MTLHPEVARLSQTLEAMTALLKLHGNEEWAEQIERCRSNIARSDYYGVERLLRLYGGMGSLNDVVLQAAGSAPAEANSRFDALRSSAWEQAQALARHQSSVNDR